MGPPQRLRFVAAPGGLMRVVIVGSQGFIGRHLVRRFRRGGADVPRGGTRPGPPEGAARELLRAWALAAGAPALWLRPFVVYGPGQTGSMVLPYAVAQAQAGQPARFSDGEQRRDFVYVDDVAEAFFAAAARAPAGFHV